MSKPQITNRSDNLSDQYGNDCRAEQEPASADAEVFAVNCAWDTSWKKINRILVIMFILGTVGEQEGLFDNSAPPLPPR